MSENEDKAKWQPVMLILDKRLDCTTCGASGIFLTGKVSDSVQNILDKADVWCFDCYRKSQEEADK